MLTDATIGDVTSTVALVVRPATVDEDLDYLVGAGQAFLRTTTYRGRVSDARAHAEAVARLVLALGRVFVAVDDQDDLRRLGFLAALVIDHPFLGLRIGTEVMWWVEPDARRRGVGRQLFAAFEAWAKAEGAVRAQFGAYRDPHLEGIYQRLGYHSTEVIYEKDL